MNKIVMSLAACVLCSGCTIQPVVVQRPAPEPAPVVVEDPPPAEVQEYYVISGRYYYWHPGYHRYVILRGALPPGRRAVAVDRFDHLPTAHPGPHSVPPKHTPPPKESDKKKKEQ